MLHDCVFPELAYTHGGHRYPSMNAVLDAQSGPLVLDPLAITTFAVCGSFLGEQTPFLDVRFARPERDKAPAVFAGDSVEACDAFVHLVREYVGGLTTAPILHPLSGGRDSRHLLFTLEHCGKRPKECVTLAGLDEEPDWAISSEVAAAVGIAHRRVRGSSTGFEYNLAQPIATDLCADEHAWLFPIAEEFRAAGSVLLDGLLGDVQINSAGQSEEDLADLARHDYRTIVQRGLDYFRPADDACIRRIGALLGVEPAPREEVLQLGAAQLEALASEPNPLAQWWREQRLTRETAFVVRNLYAGVQEVHTPYASRRIAEFMRSLPASMTMGRSLHDIAMARAYPKYAHVGYTRKGPQPKLRRRLPKLVAIANYARNALWESRYLTRKERQALSELEASMGRRRTLWVRDLLIHRREPEARARAAEVCRRIVGC